MSRTILIAILVGLSSGCARHAINNAEQQILLAPDSAESWVALGDAFRRGLKYDSAREAYQQALSLDPDNASAQAGITAVRPRRQPQVVKLALAHPLDDELWGDAGDYYLSVGLRDEAIAAYTHAFHVDPTDSEWQAALTDLGAVEQVISAMTGNIDSMDDEAIGDVADMLLSVGQSERACELYQRALGMDPEDGEWQSRVSECTGSDPTTPSSDSPDSISGTTTEIDYLTNRIFENHELLRELGMAYAKSGDADEAQRYLHSALLMAPMDTEIRSAVMVVSGRSLIDVLGQLVSEIQDNDELIGDLGDAYLAQGRHNEALNQYRAALALDNDDPEWSRLVAMLEAN